MVNFVCIKNELKSAVLSAEIDFSKENGVNFPELQYVYGTCNVNGCINEEGRVDSFFFSLDLFKIFSFTSQGSTIFLRHSLCPTFTENTH